jgi:CRP-like cAMP-binding protein
LGIEDDINIFERVPTLRALGRAALRVVAIGAETRFLDEGEVLFRAGDPTDCGYVVQYGALRLISDSRAIGEVVVGPATLLGEMALMAETRRPATAVAIQQSSVIRISRSMFLKMLEGYPDAAKLVRDQIAERAKRTIAEIADVGAMLDTSQPA